MSYALRLARPSDEPFLWEMLFEASHAADDNGGVSGPDAPREVPELARYVAGWGQRPSDIGFVGLEAADLRPIGAAWLRLLTGADAGYGYVDDATPELAIAVVPSLRGTGLGGQLLQAVLGEAKVLFPAVCLSVRPDNPARRLYERLGFRLVPGGELPNRAGGTSLTMVLRF
jgi:GNAT superfamily N-acetyltransferase